MNFILSKSYAERIIVHAVFLFLAIDMGNDFGLRNVAVIIGSVAFVGIFGLNFPKNQFFLFGILVLYPCVLLAMGVMGDADLSLAMSQFNSTFFAFVLFLIVYRVPYEVTLRAFLYSLFVVALISIALAVGLIFNVGVVRDILAIMASSGGGYFGERSVELYEAIPNIYFKATLFFTSAYVLSISLRRYYMAAVFFLGLIAAVSKTGIVVAGFVLLVSVVRFKNIYQLMSGCVALFAVIFLMIESPLYILFDEIFRGESDTVDVRVGHVKSLIDLWSENPLNLLFGFGFGSTFYSAGAGRFVSNIELDHLNVIRKYGLFWALLFFSFVLKVAYSAIKSHRDEIRGLGWALLIGFVVAGTNPVLISPVFFICLFITMKANSQAVAV